MTARELIAKLSELPPDTEVMIDEGLYCAERELRGVEMVRNLRDGTVVLET